ncbi:MAG: hypothetical protein ACK4XJ_08720 [Fimbriimonadaceae bacterium]
MMALAAALLCAPPPALEYFPLTVGTKWTYESVAGVARSTFTDEVLPEVEIAGVKAIPVSTTLEGNVVGTVYYRVDDDTIHLVALSTESLLEKPRPVLITDTKERKWVSVVGIGDPEQKRMSKMDGASRPGRTREVLGERVPTYEVNAKTEVLEDGGTLGTVTQVAIYGKGIGLIEMNEETKIPGRTLKRTVKLISYRKGAVEKG